MDWVLASSLVKKRFRSGVNIARTRSFPGAYIGSDHDLLMMTFFMRLLMLLFTSLYFAAPSGSNLFFLSSLLLSHRSRISAVIQGFLFCCCHRRRRQLAGKKKHFEERKVLVQHFSYKLIGVDNLTVRWCPLFWYEVSHALIWQPVTLSTCYE